MGGLVLAGALLSCLAALSHAFQLIDDARNKTLACQIIQSDIETTRLFSFNKLPASGAIEMPNEVKALAKNFAATRTVSDISGCKDANGIVTMKQIKVDVTWNDFKGRPHSHSYTTFYGKGGLSDYFVTNRPPIVP